MYTMKSIVPTNSPMDFPKCMYNITNPTQDLSDVNIKICDQNTSTKSIMELEERQDQLLKKLDKLYDRIKMISSCKLHENYHTSIESQLKKSEVKMEEIVLVLSPDNLPWFMKIFLKANNINFTWHIHSSTPSNKVHKIQSFFEKLTVNHIGNYAPRMNLRFIFKDATTELKITSLDLPITGNVNVLRFLCEQYPNTALYNYDDYVVESLLDTCYVLEKSSETQKQAICKKLFQNMNEAKWIHGNQFTIIDLVLFNQVKQWQNYKKSVPQQWLLNCENLMGY